jgi:hypothetical protein
MRAVAGFMKRLGAIAVPTAGTDPIGTNGVRLIGVTTVHRRRNGIAITAITVNEADISTMY